MRVLELHRHPVKSMGGESLLSAFVTELGIVGDRGWGVYDIESDTVLTARRTPELLFASARLAAGELVVTLPDGTDLDEGAAGPALTSWLDRPVELRAAGADGGRYENPLDPFGETDWVEWHGPGGAWHDSSRARVTIVSTGSLGDWDVRRFRANVVVDGSDEDALVGGRVGLGEARLSVTKRVDRCVMVTRPQPGLERDLGVLRRIHTDRDSSLSIGCLIDEPGEVALGDELVALDG